MGFLNNNKNIECCQPYLLMISQHTREMHLQAVFPQYIKESFISHWYLTSVRPVSMATSVIKLLPHILNPVKSHMNEKKTANIDLKTTHKWFIWQPTMFICNPTAAWWWFFLPAVKRWEPDQSPQTHWGAALSHGTLKSVWSPVRKKIGWCLI